MRISNDGFSRTNRETLTQNHNRTILGTRGIKTVYLQVSNADQSIINTARDTIILDDTNVTLTRT